MKSTRMVSVLAAKSKSAPVTCHGGETPKAASNSLSVIPDPVPAQVQLTHSKLKEAPFDRSIIQLAILTAPRWLRPRFPSIHMRKHCLEICRTRLCTERPPPLCQSCPITCATLPADHCCIK